MKKLYFILIPILISCQSPKTENKQELTNNNKVVTVGDSFNIRLTEVEKEEHEVNKNSALVTSLNSIYDTASSSKFHVLDNSNYTTNQKIQFTGKNKVPYGKSSMVTPTAEFSYYSFLDSSTTQNAFLNYIKSMAEVGEGGPVKLNQNVTSIKMPPMLMLVYDTVIISVKYKCEHIENNWKPFENGITNIYGENYNFRFNVGCGGPLTWKSNRNLDFRSNPPNKDELIKGH